MTIKGKYVGKITINFEIDENTEGLLPFDLFQKQVHEELDGFLQDIISEEMGELGNIKVEKVNANIRLE